MNNHSDNKLIGLTGNIACGKSAVAAILRKLGAPVIDADQVSRDVTAPGTAGLRSVISAFGEEILDANDQLDRKKLRALVFADPQKRKQLEAILHPLITAESLERAMDAFDQNQKLVIYEAPLLVETGRDKDLHGLICVICKPEIQLKRLMDRDQIPLAEARQFIASQAPQELKMKRATWVIENNGSLEALQEKTTKLWHQLNTVA